MEKIYGMHKLVGLQLFWSGTPTFSSGTPTFCQMGVLNSCFQNPSESSGFLSNTGLNPFENHKATRLAFNVGPLSARQGNAIQIAFYWQADNGLLIVVLRSSLLNLKKKVVSVGPPLAIILDPCMLFTLLMHLRNVAFHWLASEYMQLASGLCSW